MIKVLNLIEMLLEWQKAAAPLMSIGYCFLKTFSHLLETSLFLGQKGPSIRIVFGQMNMVRQPQMMKASFLPAEEPAEEQLYLQKAIQLAQK